MSSASTPLSHRRTIPDLLRVAAERHGDREAIVDGEARITYARLAELVQHAAGGLLAAEVQPGDRVCVWAPNTYHWIVAAVAAQSVGAALVPLNTRYMPEEALDILARTRARVLFAPDRFLGRDYLASLRAAQVDGGGDAAGAGPISVLPALELVVLIPAEGGAQADEPGVLGWEELLERGRRAPADEVAARAASVGPDDISDILFTSGTTGRPKGAMSAHRQTIAVAEAWAERAEVRAEDRYLIVAPFFHTFGYKAGFVVCFLHGATVVPALTFDLDRVIDVVEREGVTILPGPPTIFQTLLAHPARASRDLSTLRLAVTGSAMVPVALIERMRSGLAFESVLTAYGLTEAVVVTMCRRDDEAEVIARTSGCATADFEIRIVDASGSELPAGEPGEIQLRGPNVMLGYLDDPGATAAAIEPDGWFHTGDIGYLDDRGYLTITDRLKDMFTVGGFNVYPAEVENVLARLDDIVAGAVVGVPDERLGEVGAAFVVAREGHALDEATVIGFCRERLANFKVPRRVTFVDELPRNASGKVLKGELQAMAGAAAPGRAVRRAAAPARGPGPISSPRFTVPGTVGPR